MNSINIIARDSIASHRTRSRPHLRAEYLFIVHSSLYMTAYNITDQRFTQKNDFKKSYKPS